MNCPITIEDVDTYYKIYKKNVLALKRNMTRKKPDIQSTSVIKVPPWILDKHTIVTLYCDVFFISKISFLGTVAKDLIVRMVLMPPVRAHTHVRHRGPEYWIPLSVAHNSSNLLGYNSP